MTCRTQEKNRDWIPCQPPVDTSAAKQSPLFKYKYVANQLSVRSQSAFSQFIYTQ